MPIGMLRVLAILACLMPLTACLSSRPLLMEGDATFARVQYSGDLAATLPLATQHCAGYERVARLRVADGATAIYDCARR